MAEELKDSLGRTIKLRKLNALLQLRLYKAMGAEGSNIDNYTFMAECAAMVESIDGVPNPFPRTERDIEASVQLLDDAGMGAVMAHRAIKILETRKADAEAANGDSAGPLATSAAS